MSRWHHIGSVGSFEFDYEVVHCVARNCVGINNYEDVRYDHANALKWVKALGCGCDISICLVIHTYIHNTCSQLS